MRNGELFRSEREGDPVLDPLHQFHGLDDFNDGPNAPAAARCCTALSAHLSHRTCTSFHSIADAAVVHVLAVANLHDFGG